MHKTALDHADAFFKTYGRAFEQPAIVEIGSADVNGSLRQVAPARSSYVGLDYASGPGVDIVLSDPYQYPIPTASVDIVVTSSCLEHADFFWLSFLEIMRILKDDGVAYLNVPSNGSYHRFPTDSWRFYPDAGLALSRWARRNGYRSLLLESFVGWQDTHVWNDFIAVFVKDRQFGTRFPHRMFRLVKNPTNVIVDESDNPQNLQPTPQDVRRTLFMAATLANVLNGLKDI